MNPPLMMAGPWGPRPVPTSEELRDCGLLSGTTFVYTFHWGWQVMVVLPLDMPKMKPSDVVTDGRTKLRLDFDRLLHLCKTGQLMPVKIAPASLWMPAS